MTQTWTHQFIKKKRKAYYHVPFSGGRRGGSSERAANGKLPQGGKEHGSRKIKVMFNAATTHPSPGAALCRCGGRRDLCLRAKRISGGIYADVEQNGWSDLVICESSKGEKMSHWTQPPVRVCFQLSGWLPASLSHSTRILSQLVFSSSLCTCSHFFPLNMCFSPCFLSTKAIFFYYFSSSELR